MAISGFAGSGAGGNNGTIFYNGWNQAQQPNAVNPGQTNDSLRLLQAKGQQDSQQQLTGLQYGAADSAANRAQQQWSQLTGQGFQGSQNDANRALQQALQNSSQAFQGEQAGLNRGWQTSEASLNRALQTALQNSSQDFQGGQNAANRGWQSGEAALNRDLQTSQSALQRQFEGDQATANRGQQLTLQGNQLGFEGTQAGLNRGFTGEQNAANRQFEGEQGAAQRALQLQLGMAPINFAQQKFNTVMPLISGLMGGVRANMGGGGAMAPQPSMGSGDIWTQAQIDQQVNAAKAGNAQQASTASHNAARQTAGRGFGANSPLLAALQGQIQMGQMGTDADAERGIRLDSAKANAQNRLATGSLAEQKWLDAQDQNLRRQQLAFSGPASLLGALSGFA